MFNVGGLEFAVIAIVALLVFGPKRLPEVSRQIGSALSEFRRVQNQVKAEIDDAIHFDDSVKKPSRASLASRPVPSPSDAAVAPTIDTVAAPGPLNEHVASPETSTESNDG